MLNLIINIVSIIVISINIFILITIIRMHLKQKSIREGYFKVIIAQITVEILLNLIILAIIILLLIFDKCEEQFFYYLSIIGYYFYNCDLLYYIQTIFYLINTRAKKDLGDAFNDDLSRSSRSSDIIPSHNTIKIKKYTFISTHIISFIISILQSAIFYFTLYKPEDINCNWYYSFLIKEKRCFIYLLVFCINYLFFVLSLCYCCMRQKINRNIKLKFYSCHCLVISLIGLFFPIKMIIDNYNGKNVVDEDIITIIYVITFLFYLIETCVLRLNCYYVQYILSSSKKSKFIFGLKILFTKQKIPSPDFIDFNNSFLYHSLSTENDFSNGIGLEKQMKGGEDNEIDVSKSIFEN